MHEIEGQGSRGWERLAAAADVIYGIVAGGRMVTTALDNPIRDPSQDVLGRMPLAASFARRVHALDARDGVVVGVYGPWGSGKTSFLNLAKNAFEELGVDVLEFNPWFFGDTGHLLNRFFGDLSSKMHRVKRLKKLATSLAEYGLAVGGSATQLSESSWPYMLFAGNCSPRVAADRCQAVAGRATTSGEPGTEQNLRVV